MTIEIKTTSGHIISTKSETLKQMEKGLDKLLRPIEQKLKMKMIPMMNKAKRNWPYDYHTKDKIRHSVDQFYISSKKIISGQNIQLKVSIHNNAEYAYMIRTSYIFQSETKTGSAVPIPSGSNAFNKLLFEPIKKQAQRVAEELANEYIKSVRMVS